MPDRNYYMIRAMLSRENDFKIFFDNNVVAVGWSKVDFASLPNSHEVKNAVRQSYYEKSDKAQQAISKNLNEVERFKDMKKGDYILVPFNSYIALAKANEKEIYSQKDYVQDLANQRSVNYRYENGKLLIIPRNELSEGLQRRLRVHGNTVATLFVS